MTNEEVRQQEIGAYYGELGVTSEGDLLFYMYDMNPGLQYVIAVEYEDKFSSIPEPLKSIVDAMALDEDKINKYLKNPTKAEAQRDNMLVLLENPITALVKKKGKRIDWSNVQAGPASQQAGQAGQPAGTYVWAPLTSEQWEQARLLAGDVSGLQLLLAEELAIGLQEDIGQQDDEQFVVETTLALQEQVFRSASFEFAKLWPSVRGALVSNADDAGPLDALWMALQEVEEDGFLDTLADVHPLIIDGDFAKALLKALGETGIKKDADGRVLQAKKVALFIELTSRHGLDKSLAKAMVDQAYEQIPF
jgi:hypothetical protein